MEMDGMDNMLLSEAAKPTGLHGHAQLCPPPPLSHVQFEKGFAAWPGRSTQASVPISGPWASFCTLCSVAASPSAVRMTATSTERRLLSTRRAGPGRGFWCRSGSRGTKMLKCENWRVPMTHLVATCGGKDWLPPKGCRIVAP